MTPSAKARIRALLVDDHPVVRAGYKLLLQHAGEIEVIAEADSGELACRHYVDCRPDVVIMDLSLRSMSGLEAIRRIVSRDAAAKVLVFSMHEDTMFAERALAAGARGYITKSSAPHVLVEAVKQVAAGGVFIDQDIAQRLAFQKVGGRSAALKDLSTREFEIFCLLAGGATTGDIGRRLSLSSKTVANYATQIKAKLGVGTVAELTRLAIRHGVVDA
jgi:two-component system, NarL family, invasion response regulator UvrY